MILYIRILDINNSTPRREPCDYMKSPVTRSYLHRPIKNTLGPKQIDGSVIVNVNLDNDICNLA
jgi:hypothetical protein